ncbi:MAG TPA: biotin/lipoyl-containing protein [Candidatus Eisenbacteria bacterium]|nr:biotin/lipoyl-containing protein [Candidatus Eisenbacteria bacterium]
MNLVLHHDGRDLTAVVTPSGDGFVVTIDGREVRVEGSFGPFMRVRIDGKPVEATVRREGTDLVVERDGVARAFRVRDPRAPALGRRREAADLTRGEVHAPMPGLVVDVLVRAGDSVETGQPVVVVEAMKMQNALTAPLAGKVSSVAVQAGTAVETGALLLAIRPDEG